MKIILSLFFFWRYANVVLNAFYLWERLFARADPGKDDRSFQGAHAAPFSSHTLGDLLSRSSPGIVSSRWPGFFGFVLFSFGLSSFGNNARSSSLIPGIQFVWFVLLWPSLLWAFVVVLYFEPLCFASGFRAWLRAFRLSGLCTFTLL